MQLVPSQAKELIDRFNELLEIRPTIRPSHINVFDHQLSILRTVVQTIDAIPQSYLTFDFKSGGLFMLACNDIELIIAQAEAQPIQSRIVHGAPQWTPMQAVNDQAPGVRKYGTEWISELLGSCPDLLAGPTISTLPFVSDPIRRQDLVQDLDAVEVALRNNEYKASTILGGALIEALLLWALEQDLSKLSTHIATAYSSGALKKKPKSTDPNDWVLYEYVAVAAAASLINADTEDLCDKARNYRNLIHPGVALRTAQQCTRRTALATTAALVGVIEDLSVRFP